MNKSKHSPKKRMANKLSTAENIAENKNPKNQNSSSRSKSSRRKQQRQISQPNQLEQLDQPNQLDQLSQDNQAKEHNELAIVAGEGGLAPIIAREAIARGEKPLIIILGKHVKKSGEKAGSKSGEKAGSKSEHSPSADSFHVLGCRILYPASPWQALHLARKNGVRRVVFAGKYRRSSSKREAHKASRNVILAFITKRLVSRFGDDRVMRRIAGLLRLFAIRVVAPQEIYPSLCPERLGALGRIKTTRGDRRDIQFAKKVLDKLAPMDISQSIVVASGLVLGIETLAGTDALLESVRSLKKQRDIEGGVLVKLPKIGQSKELDLPAIGTETLRMVARANLNGIAIESQGALLIPPEKTIAKADESSLFIQVLPQVLTQVLTQALPQALAQDET